MPRLPGYIYDKHFFDEPKVYFPIKEKNETNKYKMISLAKNYTIMWKLKDPEKIAKLAKLAKLDHLNVERYDNESIIIEKGDYKNMFSK